MPSIDLKLDGDNAWPDLKDKADFQMVQLPIGVAVLPGGMQSGMPSVAFRLDLPDGSTIVAETSLALFAAAARAIRARYADEWLAVGGA